MEKTNKNNSSSSKTAGADAKTKQDGTNKYNRTPKHKENVYSRPEAVRRPTPQRSRTAYDKRPRSRGGYGTERDRSEVARGEKLEGISVVKPGNKKLSLNHLLNFTLAPSLNGSNDYRSGRWQGGRNVRRQKLPKYNKEQFLQANCQFVVKGGGDYTVYGTDPDILVNWDLVEEIHLPSHEVPSCPICLYPPVAAKITRCGHIYCWSCVLHYLSLTDKTWRKCPICYEAIHKVDLKSVVPMAKPTYSVGDEITMCLMKRKRGSVISKPVSQYDDLSSNNPVCLNDDASCFQKLLIATKDDVKNIIKREYEELVSQLAKEGDMPEACFMELALELLREREKSLMDMEMIERDMFEFLSINDKSEISKNIQNLDRMKEENNDYENHNSSIEYMIDPFIDEEHDEITYPSIDITPEITTVQPTVDNNKSSLEEISSSPENKSITDFTENSNIHRQNQAKNQGKDYYYFYQAIDGQHIYLHPINVHMLVREFGNLEHCPHTFLAKVVDLEGVTMNETLRQRLRYLHHLPLTCEFQVAELQLKPPVVSPTTLEAFTGEIEKRNRMRRRKAKEERRRERHIEQEENKKLGKYPGIRCHLDSLHHFPSCNTMADIAVTDSPPLIPENSTLFEQALQNDSVDSHTNSANDTQPASFAQMLREGKTKPQSSCNSAMVDSNKIDNAKATSVTTPDSDGENHGVPIFRQSMGDAIQAALDNMSHQGISTENRENSVKKKKGKKTLLFTTSMNRRQ